MSRLGLAVPLYDEEVACEGVARGLVEALKGAKIPFDLVLVNNGSRDGTGAILNRLSVEFDAIRAVHLEENAGYGGGILAGMRQLRTPVVGWCWGDGQIDPEVVVAAWERLQVGDVDWVKARRTERQDGLQRLLVTRTYNAWMRLYGVGTDDVNGCPKLFKRSAWRSIQARSTDWFLDPEVVLKARELGLTFAEVEAVMRPRAGGASKVRGETLAEFVRHLIEWRRGWRP